MIIVACHNDYLKERTWIEIREHPQCPPKSSNVFVGDDLNYVAI
jgi:hypothetical protein